MKTCTISGRCENEPAPVSRWCPGERPFTNHRLQKSRSGCFRDLQTRAGRGTGPLPFAGIRMAFTDVISQPPYPGAKPEETAESLR